MSQGLHREERHNDDWVKDGIRNRQYDRRTSTTYIARRCMRIPLMSNSLSSSTWPLVKSDGKQCRHKYFVSALIVASLTFRDVMGERWIKLRNTRQGKDLSDAIKVRDVETVEMDVVRVVPAHMIQLWRLFKHRG